jgi:branched-chain amino acid transport system permease protein
MDWSIASILTLDGLTNGAVYALLALATVLLFAITRVIFIAQGEFVAYGALTVAMLQSGNPVGSVWQRLGDLPGTVWLLLAAALATALVEGVRDLRAGLGAGPALAGAARTLALPVLLFLVARLGSPRAWPLWAQSVFALAVVTPLGPLIYRLAYDKVADASVLVLLIVSVGVHFALTGLGLVFFGAEGFRNPSFWEARFDLGSLAVNGQALIVLAVSLLLMAALYAFFEHTLRGKALRATAISRLGARLMGISTGAAGRFSFGLAAFIGALSGVLIGPTTTIYYDSGFLFGLKGFVAAVFGGLASYPVAALGALGVGLLESYSSFWASAFKEVIVFTAIIPALLWRSFSHGAHDEEA